MSLHGLSYFFLKLLASPASMGCIFLILGAILAKFPAKKINMYYGYRTPRSMLNQDTWNVANAFSGMLMQRIGAISIFVGVVLSLTPASLLFVAMANAGLTLATAIILVVLTERKLNNEFDKDGIRKSQSGF
jgi:uncharacterized membrane protein